MKWKAVGIGLLAAGALFGFFWIVTSSVSGSATAAAQFMRYWYWIIANLLGFGTQVGLFTYARLRHATVGSAALAGSGSTSAVSMVACCAHRLVDLLPFLGIAAFATIVARYQTSLFAVGLVSNILGIWYVWKRVMSNQ
jgi:hypothetical protein